MLTIYVLVAALLISLRGVVQPFWGCTTFSDVVERAMRMSELEWHGVLFCAVLACVAAEEITRAAV
jgi:hypothetical protein